MKLIGITAVGVTGGMLFGSMGMLPFRDSTAPMQTVTHKLVISNNERATTDDHSQASEDPYAQAEANLAEKVSHLERGLQFLAEAADYTTEFQKQEVVGGELLEEQTMVLKCRHQPYSVYLVWLTGDTGREVLYIEGQNDGKMIAHDGGWRARIPALTLSTDCWLAMRDTRYPATKAGFAGLIDTMLKIHQQDLVKSNFATCDKIPQQTFDGRPCVAFVTTYKSKDESPEYRKSITLIDEEWHLPLHSEHFDWPQPGSNCSGEDLDKATLIESYSFRDVKFRCQLTDHDFDRANSEYSFR